MCHPLARRPIPCSGSPATVQLLEHACQPGLPVQWLVQAAFHDFAFQLHNQQGQPVAAGAESAGQLVNPQAVLYELLALLAVELHLQWLLTAVDMNAGITPHASA